LYPAAGEEAIDLLQKMLAFNPFFRLTIDECLNHSFFKKCRKPIKEQEAKEIITLDWDNYE